ncbi:MAG: DUF3473 domain-containing protein [Planctomycetota bacterium]
MSLAHALSIDVEDWFQVLNMARSVAREDWDRMELRCADSTRRLLDLLDRRGARATFFFLGWIADRLPDLVADVRAAGHEIGSHGHAHVPLHDLGRHGFEEDLRRASDALRRVTGEAPRSYRACTWSVTRRTPWAFRVLLDQGIDLDSSVFPVRHPDYGIPGAPLDPFRVAEGADELVEFPPLVSRVFGARIGVGGGGYLRLLPLRILCSALRKREARGVPGCVYVHPWEVDPSQPRRSLGVLRSCRHYVNLARTMPKLERLLAEFRFVGLAEALAQRGASWRAKLPAYSASGLLG